MKKKKAQRIASILVVIAIIAIPTLLICDANHCFDPQGNHAPIEIRSDDDLHEVTRTTGGGSGTEADPYIIENLKIAAYESTGIWLDHVSGHIVIRNCEIWGDKGSGIRVNGECENLTIRGCTFRDLLDGIYLHTFHEISNCTFKNCGNYIYGYNLVKDMSIIGNYFTESGFSISSLTNCTIRGNYFIGRGISMDGCENNAIEYNTFQDASISLPEESSNITGNVFIRGGFSIFHRAIPHQEIDISNTVNGKLVHVIWNQTEIDPGSISNAGQVFLINCSDTVISNLNLSSTESGLCIYNSTNITIINSNFSDNHNSGIKIHYSDDITITSNTFHLNEYKAIYTLDSTNCEVSHNTITYQGEDWLFGNATCIDNDENYIPRDDIDDYTLTIVLSVVIGAVVFLGLALCYRQRKKNALTRGNKKED